MLGAEIRRTIAYICATLVIASAGICLCASILAIDQLDALDRFFISGICLMLMLIIIASILSLVLLMMFSGGGRGPGGREPKPRIHTTPESTGVVSHRR